MDSRLALVCIAVAVLACGVHGFPSSDDTGEVPRTPRLDDTDGQQKDSVPSKRSPDLLEKSPDSEKLKEAADGAADSTKLNVRFPENSKDVASLTEEGENARSKKSASAHEVFHSPHTTTVCIQVRSDQRPEVVCGPQVGEQDVKTSQSSGSARFAYQPQAAYSAAQGYYGPSRQQPMYQPSQVQPSLYNLPGSKPFIMRSPQDAQPQFSGPSPMRASGPSPQQFNSQIPAQAQGPIPKKFMQDIPSMQMGPKSVPAAARGPATPQYFRNLRTEEEMTVLKPEEKYQPMVPGHVNPQSPPSVVVHKVYQPVPMMPQVLQPNLRFNCALQPDGSPSVYPWGFSSTLRNAGQGYYIPDQSNALDALYGRSASPQQPYDDSAYYYDMQGRQAQSADQLMGSPYASGYGYDDSALYGDDAMGYMMVGRSGEQQQQWEQEQYMRAMGMTGGYGGLHARAVDQEMELFESRQKLLQMQQQLKDIEQRAAVAGDKDSDDKKADAVIKDAAIDIAVQKAESHKTPAKQRRSMHSGS